MGAKELWALGKRVPWVAVGERMVPLLAHRHPRRPRWATPQSAGAVRDPARRSGRMAGERMVPCSPAIIPDRRFLSIHHQACLRSVAGVCAHLPHQILLDRICSSDAREDPGAAPRGAGARGVVEVHALEAEAALVALGPFEVVHE